MQHEMMSQAFIQRIQAELVGDTVEDLEEDRKQRSAGEWVKRIFRSAFESLEVVSEIEEGSPPQIQAIVVTFLQGTAALQA